MIAAAGEMVHADAMSEHENDEDALFGENPFEASDDAGRDGFFAYTDGACSGNPGPGGWGALLIARKDGRVLKVRELSGAEAESTNNRMELTAAAAALEAFDRPAEIVVVTDSSYVRDGVTQWIWGWKRNGWKTADKKPVKNEDLWRRLDEAQARHRVTWEWVKGHAGHPENERADELARMAIKRLRDGE